MAISGTLRNYLTELGIEYDLVVHPRTASSMRTAQAAHVSGERIAKAVVLAEDEGYLMAILPATHRLQFGWIRKDLSHNAGLAAELELKKLFRDCEVGAIPACGAAFDLKMMVDEQLVEQPEIYFEAGDHEHLVHLSGAEYRKLIQGAERGRISRHV